MYLRDQFYRVVGIGLNYFDHAVETYKEKRKRMQAEQTKSQQQIREKGEIVIKLDLESSAFTISRLREVYNDKWKVLIDVIPLKEKQLHVGTSLLRPSGRTHSP